MINIYTSQAAGAFSQTEQITLTTMATSTPQLLPFEVDKALSSPASILDGPFPTNAYLAPVWAGMRPGPYSVLGGWEVQRIS